MLSHLLRLAFPNCSLQHMFSLAGSSSTLFAIFFCQDDVVPIWTSRVSFADYVILGANPVRHLFTHALGLSCQRFHSYILHIVIQSIDQPTSTMLLYDTGTALQILRLQG